MRIRQFLLLLVLCAITHAARADIAVVVHPDSPLQHLSQQQLSDLYLGRSRSVGSEVLQIVDQPRDSELRGRFFSLINGMDLRRVNAYWARLQFSGDTQPPAQLADSKAVVDAVRHNRLAIGYVDATTVGNGVRTILVLK